MDSPAICNLRTWDLTSSQVPGSIENDLMEVETRDDNFLYENINDATVEPFESGLYFLIEIM